MIEEISSQALVRLPEYELTAERVFNYLKAAILDGKILLGQRLTEEGLAAQLGVSRTPVREAIKRLKMEGYLIDAPRRGVIVPEPTAEQVEELNSLRHALEGLAAKLAAERIQAQELAKLRYLLEQEEQLIRKGDISALTRINIDFHVAICKAARNNMLLQMYDRLVSTFQLLCLRVQLVRQLESLGEHKALSEAIESKNPAEAERLAQLHVLKANEHYLSHFASLE